MNAIFPQTSADFLRKPIALLIDGDNLQASQYPQILAKAKKLGEVLVGRVYMDTPHLPKWSGVPGLRLMVTTTGKNAADFLMTIDAMELALRDKVARFVLASLDKEFSHLALRLREYGLEVHGIGGPKPSARLRESFKTYESLEEAETEKAVRKAEGQKLSQIDAAVTEVLQQNGRQMRINHLGSVMGNTALRADKAIKSKDLPVPGWPKYLASQGDLYTVSGSGTVQMVHLKPRACPPDLQALAPLV